MRIAALLVLVLVSTAAAESKALPTKLAKAAGEAFSAAAAADSAGDLDQAAKLYTRAIAISPHPNTAFNLADVQRRAGDLSDAIRSYERYLELAPDAADRKVVTALIAKLRATPGTLEIEISSGEPDAQVFVDGTFVGVAPIKVPALAGIHQIDIITPITYGQMPCPVSAGGRRDCRVHAKPRQDGNLVISGSQILGGRSWQVDGQRLRLKGRSTVRPGHYELVDLVDRQCKPLPLDVPAGDDIVFAYVKLPEPAPRSSRACIDVTIVQHRLAL